VRLFRDRLPRAIASIFRECDCTNFSDKIKVNRKHQGAKIMAVVRWTDEMLDELSSNVSEMRESISEMRESISEMRESVSELRESVSEVKDSVDGLRVTVQALLQVAAQHQRDMENVKQRQAENDERFNILLEEVRYLNKMSSAVPT
jgi:uncharacterized coiled-coil DUF342 family protein